MKRLFAAVKFNPSNVLLGTYNGLRSGLKFSRITWVKPENIHITLKFFGETDEKRMLEISRVLKEVAQRHDPFTIEVANVGIFGSSYNPKVIWFGIGQEEALKKLGSDVLRSVESIGWEKDRQNFVPHLTIGRIKDAVDKQLFQKVIDEHKETRMQDIHVREFHLFESVLMREGPIYKIIESYSLKS